MTKAKYILTAVIVFVVSAGCQNDPVSEKGFRLPDGDAIAGRASFEYMKCTQCHTVTGDSFAIEAPIDDPYVVLGGKVRKARTYGQLVTSIINPSHRLASGYPADLVSEDGVSNMYVYNRYMTVQELIDLVAYLQPFYEVTPPDYKFLVYPPLR